MMEAYIDESEELSRATRDQRPGENEHARESEGRKLPIIKRVTPGVMI